MSPSPRAMTGGADVPAVGPPTLRAVPAARTGAAGPDPGVISIWVLGRFAVRRGSAWP